MFIIYHSVSKLAFLSEHPKTKKKMIHSLAHCFSLSPRATKFTAGGGGRTSSDERPVAAALNLTIIRTTAVASTQRSAVAADVRAHARSRDFRGGASARQFEGPARCAERT